MPRDSEQTKARILDAATEEFSLRGLAGARIDDIAARSGSNKQLIYAYFESKLGLFEAVIAHQLGPVLNAVPITPEDLPSYAGRLFDHGHDHPKLLRLSQWYFLEVDSDSAPPPAIVKSIQEKVYAVEQAQRAGTVGSDIPALELLALILAISYAWNTGPYSRAQTTKAELARRRKAVVAAVEKLTRHRGKPKLPALDAGNGSNSER
jgi:AcrR family transcriptional regulator